MVDDGSNGQRSGIAAKEGDPAAVQDPHGSLHVVQRPLQVGGVMRDAVKLKVQQSDSCRDVSRAEARSCPFLSPLNLLQKNFCLFPHSGFPP